MKIYEPATLVLGLKFCKMGIRKKDREYNEKVKIFRNLTK